jgi:exosortase A
MMAAPELGSTLSPRPSPSIEAVPLRVSPPATVEKRAMGVALSVVLIVLGVFALYWKTTLSMVAIWARSETFAHGFVVVPIFCYLLWRQRDALSHIETRPYWPALFGVAAMGLIWLLGDLVSAASVSQLAMVGMIPAAVWTILGTRVAMALAIPLTFLVFAVPFGEFLVPTLMDRTADFTVAALRASGVPVYREGNFFIIPTGAWSVVEACSGLRYLIASLMVGCLYAYLSYRSTVRRVVFIVASLIVPIVANWMRAYMIVMIGHLSSNKLAVGADHLIYGWVFFGAVILLLLYIGSRWRQDDEPAGANNNASVNGAAWPPAEHPTPGRPPRNRLIAGAVAFVLMGVWQPLSGRVDHSENAAAVSLPGIAGIGGWTPDLEEIAPWRPDVSGARAVVRRTFVKDGNRVGLYIAFFRGQTTESKAITSTNEIVSTKNLMWRRVASGAVSITTRAGALDVRSGVITSQSERLALWQWYWVDGHLTSSDYAAKMYQALALLERHGDPTAWVIVYTPTGAGESEVHPVLQAFIADMAPAIDAALSQMASE